MSIKKPKKKTATVIASFETDLGLVLNWLKLNRAISTCGPIREVGRGYAVCVKSKMSKDDLNNLVKEKFGVFAKVI